MNDYTSTWVPKPTAKITDQRLPQHPTTQQTLGWSDLGREITYTPLRSPDAKGATQCPFHESPPSQSPGLHWVFLPPSPHAIVHWGQLLAGLFSDYELLLAMCWDPLLFSLLAGVHRQHIVNVCGGKRPQERMRAREPLNLSRA